MNSSTVTRPFSTKAVNFKQRVFEGFASTWDLDHGGDQIVKGAYSRTLENWRHAKGAVIPLVDMHNYSSIRNVLGQLVEALETDIGLWAKFRVVPGNDGDELLHRIADGAVNALSIGYRSVKDEPATVDGQRVRIIRELELREVSAVIWGMNPHALIDPETVKTAKDGVPLAGQMSRAKQAELSNRIRRLRISHVLGHSG